MTVEARFLAKVLDRPEEGCWIWGGSTSNGYAQLSIPASNDRGWTMTKAHRVAYELFIGPLGDLEVDHVCGVKNCVRWEVDPTLGRPHLEAVTHPENMIRAQKAGRMNNLFQKSKTHCPHGHPYDETNTYVDKRGSRHCKACIRERKSKEK